MTHTFQMFDLFGPFLADGDEGNKFRFCEVEPLLSLPDPIVFDFEGVTNMTDSFCNACFESLAAGNPAEVLKKVRFKHCSPLIKDFISHAVGNGLASAKKQIAKKNMRTQKNIKINKDVLTNTDNNGAGKINFDTLTIIDKYKNNRIKELSFKLNFDEGINLSEEIEDAIREWLLINCKPRYECPFIGLNRICDYIKNHNKTATIVLSRFYKRKGCELDIFCLGLYDIRMLFEITYDMEDSRIRGFKRFLLDSLNLLS